MPTRRPTLSIDNVAAYLRDRAIVPAGVTPTVGALSGGISNSVLRVDWPGAAVVVKQSLPRLRVAEVWEFDPRRILAECDCMRVLNALLPEGSVPEVLDVDESALAFTMSCAPPGGIVWKDALLAGDVEGRVARRAGTLLGEVHARSAADRGLAAVFDDLMPLVQGRTDPYHRVAARAHPDLAALIEADVRRLHTQRRALVLGDYSPKNLIVYPERVLALDFEVAHWGDPAFDTAFMLTHLIAKAVHRPGQGGKLLGAARAFWSGYIASAVQSGADERDTVAECAVLLLCRVDGKSKLEYLDDDQRELIRRLARRLIREPQGDLESLLAAVAEALELGRAGAAS